MPRARGAESRRARGDAANASLCPAAGRSLAQRQRDRSPRKSFLRRPPSPLAEFGAAARSTSADPKQQTARLSSPFKILRPLAALLTPTDRFRSAFMIRVTHGSQTHSCRSIGKYGHGTPINLYDPYDLYVFLLLQFHSNSLTRG